MNNIWPLLEKLSQHKSDKLIQEIAKTNAGILRLQQQKKSLEAALQSYQLSSENNLSISLIRNQLIFVKKLNESLNALNDNIQITMNNKQALINMWQKEKLKTDGYEKMNKINITKKQQEKAKIEQSLIEETFSAIQASEQNIKN